MGALVVAMVRRKVREGLSVRGKQCPQEYTVLHDSRHREPLNAKALSITFAVTAGKLVRRTNGKI